MRIAALLVLTVTTVAHAAPPEPSGPHPRMLLDKELKAAWKAQAEDRRGPVVGAIALCTSGQTGAHDRGLYQGAEWSRVLQACLVAWAATDDPQHATTQSNSSPRSSTTAIGSVIAWAARRQRSATTVT